jgi:hypothetical protein
MTCRSDVVQSAQFTKLHTKIMETNAYFDNIHTHIIRELKKANYDITIAVAWFTDNEIFGALCQKSKEGISVHLALLDDEINRTKSSIQFQQLVDSGGELFWIPVSASDNIMHHKFCVIDRQHVITGSYNWTRRARDNHEDIVIVSDSHEFSMQYLETFNELLLNNNYRVKAIPRMDSEAVVRRLELIRNMIELGDFDDVRQQNNKLRQADIESLQSIINLIDQQQFNPAAQQIEALIKSLRSVAIYRDPSIERLKQQLATLTYQVNALSDQKIEIERLINDFLHQHHQHLGDLIARYLELQQRIAEKRLEKIKESNGSEEGITSQAESDYQEASKDYEDYQQYYQEIESEPAPTTLTEAETAELKKCYKKATMFCHPDRVSDEMKVAATEIFNQLQTEYRNNNLEGVKSLLDKIQQGLSPTAPKVTLQESEQLTRTIADLEYNLRDLRNKISELTSGETWQTLNQITDWNVYFADKQSQLEAEIVELEQTIEEEL